MGGKSLGLGEEYYRRESTGRALLFGRSAVTRENPPPLFCRRVVVELLEALPRIRLGRLNLHSPRGVDPGERKVEPEVQRSVVNEETYTQAHGFSSVQLLDERSESIRIVLVLQQDLRREEPSRVPVLRRRREESISRIRNLFEQQGSATNRSLTRRGGSLGACFPRQSSRRASSPQRSPSRS